jgi:hypothetical protein
MSTTIHRLTSIALALGALAILTVALSALSVPAAQAQRADTGYGRASWYAADPGDIGAIVAFRKAQQSQYLVEHGLLAFR